MNSEIVVLLQKLTNSKSNSLLDLYNNFEKVFSEEKNIQAILFNFIFSENKCSESLVIKELEQLKSRGN